MKKFFLITTGSFLMLVMVAFLLPFFINLNAYKPEIINKAKEVLCRDVEIEGDLQFQILPLPSLTINRLRLGNDPKGTARDMVAVDLAKIHVALFPLFKKHIKITYIELNRPQLFFERLSQGYGNWEFPLNPKKETHEKLSEPISLPEQRNSFTFEINELRVKEGSVIYQEGTKSYAMNNLSTDIHLEALPGPYQGSGQFTYDNHDIHFDLALAEYQPQQPVKAHINALGLELIVQGNLSSLEKNFKGFVTLSNQSKSDEKKPVSTRSLSFLATPFVLKAEAFASAQEIKLTPLTVESEEIRGKGSLNISLEKETSIKGFLKDFPGGLELIFHANSSQGQMTIHIADLKILLNLLHYDRAGIPDALLNNVTLKTNINITPTLIHFYPFTFNMGSFQTEGQVLWHPKALTPSFEIEMQAKTISPLITALISSPIKQDGPVLFKGKFDGDEQELLFDTLTKWDKTSLVFKGKVHDLRHQIKLAASLLFKSHQFVTFFKTFNVTIPQPLNEIMITGDMEGDLQNLQLDVNTILDELIVRAQGTVSSMLTNPLFDLKVSTTHPDLKNFLGILGVSAHAPAGNFSLEGQLKGNPKAFKVENLKGILGTAGSFKGMVDYSSHHQKPWIVTHLTFGPIKLNPFFAFLNDSITVPQLPTFQLVSAQPSKSPCSREKLDLNFLTYFDADFKIDAPQLIKKELIFDTPHFTAEIKKGVFRIIDLSARFYEGEAHLQGYTDSTKGNESQYSFFLRNAELKNFSSKDSKVKITQGKISLEGNLTTFGESLYSLVANTNGHIALQSREGMISGFDLQEITSQLMKKNRLEGIKSLLSSSFTKGQTPFSSLEGTVEIKKGMAHLENFKLIAKGAEGSAHGLIDLPNYLLDVQTRFILTDFKNLPPLFVRFSGPLDSPLRSIDSSALQQFMAQNVLHIANDILGTIRSGKTKPAEIVNSILGTDSSDTQGKEKSAPSKDGKPTKPSVEDIAKNPEKAIKGLLNNLF